MGVGGQRHAPASFAPGKDLVPIVQEAETDRTDIILRNRT